MKNLQVGDKANVGGCIGEITQITDTQVIVIGIYYYVPDEENKPGYQDHWILRYPISDFTDYNEMFNYWNLTEK